MSAKQHVQIPAQLPNEDSSNCKAVDSLDNNLPGLTWHVRTSDRGQKLHADMDQISFTAVCGILKQSKLCLKIAYIETIEIDKSNTVKRHLHSITAPPSLEETLPTKQAVVFVNAYLLLSMM